MSNDLTFFTNEASASLLDRFKSTLAHVQYFDVLVGYFRSSGESRSTAFLPHLDVRFVSMSE